MEQTPEDVAEADIETPSLQAESRHLAGSPVLLLDDEEPLRLLVAEVLTLEGFTVEHTDDPSHALELLLVDGRVVVERDRVVTVDESAVAREAAAVHKSLVRKAG